MEPNDNENSYYVMLLFFLFEKGIDTFGGAEHFEQWMVNKQDVFNAMTPIEVVNTMHGISKVYDHLLSIDYDAIHQ